MVILRVKVDILCFLFFCGYWIVFILIWYEELKVIFLLLLRMWVKVFSMVFVFMFFIGWKGMNIGRLSFLLWMVIWIIFLGWRFFLIWFSIFWKVFLRRLNILFILFCLLKRWLLKVSLYEIFLIFIVLRVFFLSRWMLKLFFLFLICIVEFWVKEGFGNFVKLKVFKFFRSDWFLWNEDFVMLWKLYVWIVFSKLLFLVRVILF